MRTETKLRPSVYVAVLLVEMLESTDSQIAAASSGTQSKGCPSLMVPIAAGGGLLVLLFIPNHRAKVDRIPTFCGDSGCKGANSVNLVGDSRLLAILTVSVSSICS